jgi:RHS repeat-associated protein
MAPVIRSGSIALAALVSAALAPTIASAASTSSARSASTPMRSSPAIASAPIGAQPKNRVRAIELGSGGRAVDAGELRAENASRKITQSVEDCVGRASYGKEHDQLSDLYYYGKRYFDPLSLTWTQADPLFRFAPEAAWDQPRRANLYGFSLNNPLRYQDPDGRDGILATACGAAGEACIVPAAAAAFVVSLYVIATRDPNKPRDTSSTTGKFEDAVFGVSEALVEDYYRHHPPPIA